MQPYHKLVDGKLVHDYDDYAARKFDPNSSLDHFHHGHEDDRRVDHCGAPHPGMEYTVGHCPCGKHKIDKLTAAGHGARRQEVKFIFPGKCPHGGRHLESGLPLR